MTVFHFIRHGEVENLDNLYYGRLPGFPLSRMGKACVALTADQLAGYPIEAIYYSPLQRTQQTAVIVGQRLNVTPQLDERLIEIASFYEGRPQHGRQTVPHYPGAPAGYAEMPEEIYDRMARFLRDRAEMHAGHHVVAVSHNGPIRMLELGLQGRPFSDDLIGRDPMPTCGAETVITVDGSRIQVKRQEFACSVGGHTI